MKKKSHPPAAAYPLVPGTGFINAARPAEIIPQGLKPPIFSHFCGTAEAVPFQSPIDAICSCPYSLFPNPCPLVPGTGFINAARPAEIIPQGLKPPIFSHFCGTAEAVPFQSRGDAICSCPYSLFPDPYSLIPGAGFINAARPAEIIPQGLKPPIFSHFCGTAEAVPFQSPIDATCSCPYSLFPNPCPLLPT